MTQAENYEMLFDANKQNARDLAENMSVWKEQNWSGEGSTIFGFEDGSAIYASGPDFRVATPEEIAAAQ